VANDASLHSDILKLRNYGQPVDHVIKLLFVWESRKLMGGNIEVVRDKFPTLSQAVFVLSVNAWHTQTCPGLELKTRPRFHPVSLSLSMIADSKG
jgi:hypothetical protein